MEDENRVEYKQDFVSQDVVLMAVERPDFHIPIPLDLACSTDELDKFAVAL